MISRCRGGATANSVLAGLDTDIQHWELVLAAERLTRGSIAYWVTANDVYSKFTGYKSIDPYTLQKIGFAVTSTIKRIAAATDHVVVLGPLPRPDGDLAGIAWEKTAAYHLERTAKKVVDELNERQELRTRLTFVPLGRCLTKKQGGRHAVREECSRWYCDDRIHLNRAGYEKISDAEYLPLWLEFNH